MSTPDGSALYLADEFLQSSGVERPVSVSAPLCHYRLLSESDAPVCQPSAIEPFRSPLTDDGTLFGSTSRRRTVSRIRFKTHFFYRSFQKSVVPAQWLWSDIYNLLTFFFHTFPPTRSVFCYFPAIYIAVAMQGHVWKYLSESNCACIKVVF